MTRWHVSHAEHETTLAARGAAPTWDVSVACAWSGPALSPAARLRMAHQVRQDIWRACRGIRGFVPRIEVSTPGDEIAMRAGGSLASRLVHVPTLEAAIARVLASERNRARWLRHATRDRRGRETCSTRS